MISFRTVPFFGAIYCSECERTIEVIDQYIEISILVIGLDIYNFCMPCIDRKWPEMKENCDPIIRFYE
jgi:hypothetical protein